MANIIMPNSDVSKILVDLSNGAQSHRKAAMCALSLIKDEIAGAALCDILVNREEDSDTRRHAAACLGIMHSMTTLPTLMQTISDSDDNVKEGVAYALGWFPKSPVIMETLIQTLSDQTISPDARAIAAESLGKLKSKKSVTSLIAALDDTNVKIRFFSARALGHIGSDKAVPALKRIKKTDKGILAIKPDGGSVSNEAARAIAAIKKKH